ncbi:MAG: hypothetical protein RI958_2255, partial [Actinomycetota bacterium]
SRHGDVAVSTDRLRCPAGGSTTVQYDHGASGASYPGEVPGWTALPTSLVPFVVR